MSQAELFDTSATACVSRSTLYILSFCAERRKKLGLLFQNKVLVLKLQNCELLQWVSCVAKHVLKKGFSFGGLLQFRRIVVLRMQKFDWTMCSTCVGRFAELTGHYIRFEALDK